MFGLFQPGRSLHVFQFIIACIILWIVGGELNSYNFSTEQTSGSADATSTCALCTQDDDGVWLCVIVIIGAVASMVCALFMMAAYWRMKAWLRMPKIMVSTITCGYWLVISILTTIWAVEAINEDVSDSDVNDAKLDAYRAAAICLVWTEFILHFQSSIDVWWYVNHNMAKYI